MMLAISGVDPQVPLLITGGLSALFGAITACLSFLCIRGKIKPNPYVGVRFNLSRNYRLYNQKNYWYEINRYGGKKVLPIAIAWILLSLAAIVLPFGPGVNLGILSIVTMLVVIGLALTARQIYRYADELTSHDTRYIQKT